MDWTATELEDGVVLQLQDDDTLTSDADYDLADLALGPEGKLTPDASDGQGGNAAHAPSARQGGER